MAITLSTYHEALEAAIAAVEASDWAMANKKYAVAELALAGLENTVQKESDMISYRENLSKVSEAIKRALESSSKQRARSRMIRTRLGYGL